MNSVQCVSLPRSGHNMLVKHLQEYFQGFSICNSESPSVETGKLNFHYCEYYYACRSHPCIDTRNHFQKSHDFDLKLPIIDNQKYIIQYRRPISLLISWYEMRLLKKRERNTPAGFTRFANRHREYLERFRAKWLNSRIESRMTLAYEDYLTDPINSLHRVINFFDPEHSVDICRIENITADVYSSRDDRDFRFYDAAQKLERFAA